MEPDLHDQQQQRVHSVVIITLPPSDDPSKGKTISAYTLTDLDYPPEIHPEDERNPSFQPDPLHQQSGLWYSDLAMSSPRLVLGLLGVSLLAIAFYGSVFPNTIQMFSVSEERDRDDDSRRETTSFVFPVYHKLRAREIPDRNLAEVLGIVENGIVESIDQELVNPVKVNNLLSASASSSAIFPAHGNVYPDGFYNYFTRILLGSPEDGHYFHLDIDTGSDLTWIQCDAPCTSCAKVIRESFKGVSGDGSKKNSKENATAVLLVASQKTLPVMVAVVEQLRGAFGESGLLVLPCVAAHLNQIMIIDSILVNLWLRKGNVTSTEGQ